MSCVTPAVHDLCEELASSDMHHPIYIVSDTMKLADSCAV